MKLKLHELQKPLTLSLSESDDWFRNIFAVLKLKTQGPLSLHLVLTKEKEDIFFEGHLKVKLILNCSRCAEDAPYVFDEFFYPVFTHGQDPHEKDAELSKSELDITYFKEDEVDVAEVIREQIELMLPLQPLCASSCKGICPQCGQNLNIKSCACKKDDVHSPFQVLKDFKVIQKKRRK